MARKNKQSQYETISTVLSLVGFLVLQRWCHQLAKAEIPSHKDQKQNTLKKGGDDSQANLQQLGWELEAGSRLSVERDNVHRHCVVFSKSTADGSMDLLQAPGQREQWISTARNNGHTHTCPA